MWTTSVYTVYCNSSLRRRNLVPSFSIFFLIFTQQVFKGVFECKKESILSPYKSYIKSYFKGKPTINTLKKVKHANYIRKKITKRPVSGCTWKAPKEVAGSKIIIIIIWIKNTKEYYPEIWFL